jgi:hypothetical protein
MLMNHPDSPANGIGRMANRSGLAVNADQAAISGVESIENADKGGFSSAIFPDDTVNMARHDLQVDVPVCMNVTETLINSG